MGNFCCNEKEKGISKYAINADEKSEKDIDNIFQKFFDVENRKIKSCEVTEEDCSKLNLLLNNIPNQFYFLKKLNHWRNIGPMMPENVLEFLGGAFSFIISK